jgi:hypothetical protein
MPAASGPAIVDTVAEAALATSASAAADTVVGVEQVTAGMVTFVPATADTVAEAVLATSAPVVAGMAGEAATAAVAKTGAPKDAALQETAVASPPDIPGHTASYNSLVVLPAPVRVGAVVVLRFPQASLYAKIPTIRTSLGSSHTRAQ